MHNLSYLRVMFALLIPDGFTQRCDHGITCHCRFRIQYHTHTHAHTPTHTFPLFCISQTIGPIESKLCMHMECDQTIKSHKNIKLIWGHLGYANEGQWRHNVLRLIEVISLTGDWFSPKFWYVVAETILYKTNDINLTILWRHHSQIFDQRRQCRIFHICVLCVWEVTFFFPNMNLHGNDLWAVSRLL